VKPDVNVFGIKVQSETIVALHFAVHHWDDRVFARTDRKLANSCSEGLCCAESYHFRLLINSTFLVGLYLETFTEAHYCHANVCSSLRIGIYLHLIHARVILA
jgi:hypothetical protein